MTINPPLILTFLLKAIFLNLNLFTFIILTDEFICRVHLLNRSIILIVIAHVCTKITIYIVIILVVDYRSPHTHTHGYNIRTFPILWYKFFFYHVTRWVDYKILFISFLNWKHDNYKSYYILRLTLFNAENNKWYQNEINTIIKLISLLGASDRISENSE